MNEADKIIQEIQKEIRMLERNYPNCKNIISKHRPEYRIMFLKGRLRELKRPEFG
jgi:hypothetical protein